MSDYVEAYPHLADEIRDVFPALLVVEDADPGTEDLCAGAVDTSVDLGHAPILCLGDYNIIQEIGRGAMGIVYEAEQQSLGRRVALKVLPKSLSDKSRSLTRFRNEAKAAARLHHTNIVSVYEVGQDEGVEFYAMQLIHGQSLDKVIAELRRIRDGDSDNPLSDPATAGARTAAISMCRGRFATPTPLDETEPQDVEERSEVASDHDDIVGDHVVNDTSSAAAWPAKEDSSTADAGQPCYFRSVAHIGMQVADALAYAHARGVVHRDIKPSNLILDNAGIVWVADFGLAKFGEDGVTRTGDVVGTILHMSPERFQGECEAIADVYSLGTTLYELVTLRPAFESTDRLALINQIRIAEPIRPKNIDPRVPRDLETIITKAMAKEQGQRYQSAGEMAEDLKRFLNDEPIHARRVLPSERLIRWSRRNKAYAASLATVALLLIAIAVGATVIASQSNNRARVAVEHEKQARKDREEIRRLLYVSEMSRAKQAWEDGDLRRLETILKRWRQTGAEEDLRGWEWYYLWLHWKRQTDLPRFPHGGRRLALSPDHQTAAVISHYGQGVKLLDIATGKVLDGFVRLRCETGIILVLFRKMERLLRFRRPTSHLSSLET